MSIGNTSSNYSTKKSTASSAKAGLQKSAGDTTKEIQNFFSASDLRRLAKTLQEDDRRSKLKMEVQQDLSYHELGNVISKINDNSIGSMDRYYSLQKLYIYSIGFQTNYKSLQRNLIKKNNNILIKLNALGPLVKNLRVLIGVVLDEHSSSGQSSTSSNEDPKKPKLLYEFISAQVDFILDTLWMMMVTGAGNEVFIQDLVSLEPFFVGFLLETTEKLAEGTFVQLFSLRKVCVYL